jgi:hypothetical protein
VGLRVGRPALDLLFWGAGVAQGGVGYILPEAW